MFIFVIKFSKIASKYEFLTNSKLTFQLQCLHHRDSTAQIIDGEHIQTGIKKTLKHLKRI